MAQLSGGPLCYSPGGAVIYDDTLASQFYIHVHTSLPGIVLHRCSVVHRRWRKNHGYPVQAMTSVPNEGLTPDYVHRRPIKHVALLFACTWLTIHDRRLGRHLSRLLLRREIPDLQHLRPICHVQPSLILPRRTHHTLVVILALLDVVLVLIS